MDDIAAAAGVARQTVYAHYPARHALIAAIVDRLTAETVAELQSVDVDAGAATDALGAWLTRSWQLIHRYPILLTSVIAAASDAGDYERHVPIMDSLRRILDRGRCSGEFQAGPPVQWQVSAIIALGHAAGAEVIAGRMNTVDAGAAFSEAALRVTAGTRRP